MKSQLNILFISISEKSFEEAFFVSRILAHLPENTKSYCMVNTTSAAFVASNPKNMVSLLTENLDSNYHDFQIYLKQAELNLIVLLDLHHYFIVPAEMNFLPEWLQDLSIPIVALDYFDLLHYQGDQLTFKGAEDPAAPLATQQFMPLAITPTLLKPSPPHRAGAEADSRVMYWNTALDFYRFVKPSTQELIRSTMQLEPNVKVISLLFDASLVGRAIETHLLGFYMVAVEVLGFYLRQFPDQHFQLLVVGFKQPQEENISIPNLKVRFFTHLTEDIYQLVACGSDLLILNSNWSLLHADALVTGTPTLVLGNSIMQEVREGEKVLTSAFQPHPFLYQLVEIMIRLNNMSPMVPIYPFISYPVRQPDLPPVGLQSGFLPYHLADMFNDIATQPLLEKLLFDEAYLNEYRQYAEQYLAQAAQPENLATLLGKQIYVNQSA